ncbi:hypothetical protein AB0M95_35440 [Sphaerisporangium sp. NPDC051017]|uniref:hypothetical protein n=1 Tax=Sphaerisporangium sp. NPDC051017 TaxID=3154636 RepID=UPI003449BC29
MARFVAGSRFGRLLAVGGLIAVGWVLGLLFGLAGTASAEPHVPSGHVAAAGRAGEDVQVSPVAASQSQAVAGASAGTSAAARGPAFAPPPHAPLVASGPAPSGGFPTVSDTASADAGAMAGRSVDGLTSQSKPAHPTPSTADHSAGADGIVPRGGGSGPFGPGLGDVARSVFDPRLVVAPAVRASAPAPVVRTAADDPSFSPD